MRGLLQKEVAEVLDLSLYTILHWEQNQTEPGPAHGPRIVAWLGYLPLSTETLPERLYAIRFAKGWTQRQLAEALGIGEDAAPAAEGGKVLTRRIMETIEPKSEALLAEIAAVGRRGDGWMKTSSLSGAPRWGAPSCAYASRRKVTHS